MTACAKGLITDGQGPERLCSQRFDRRELSSQLSSLRHVFPPSASASVYSSSFSFFPTLPQKRGGASIPKAGRAGLVPSESERKRKRDGKDKEKR